MSSLKKEFALTTATGPVSFAEANDIGHPADQKQSTPSSSDTASQPVLHDSPGITIRGPNIIESIESMIIGTPDQKSISKLLMEEDTQRMWNHAFTWSGSYQSGDRKRTGGLLPSAVLLDQALLKADPATKQNLVDDAVEEAAQIESTFWDRVHPPGRRDPGFTVHHARDIPEKLQILARHGGDLNIAVQGTKNPELIVLNAKALLDSGQTLSRESAEHILAYPFYLQDLRKYDKAWDRSRPDSKPHGMKEYIIYTKNDEYGLKRAIDMEEMLDQHGLMPAILRASGGQPFKNELLLHTQNPKVIALSEYELNNPLQLALAIDPNNGVFDELLAKGAKANDADLYFAAINSKSPEDAIRKLKDYGFDADAKNADGKTVFDMTMTMIEKGYRYEPREFQNKDKLVFIDFLRQAGVAAEKIEPVEKDIRAAIELKEESGNLPKTPRSQDDIDKILNAQRQELQRKLQQDQAGPAP